MIDPIVRMGTHSILCRLISLVKPDRPICDIDIQRRPLLHLPSLSSRVLSSRLVGEAIELACGRIGFDLPVPLVPVMLQEPVAESDIVLLSQRPDLPFKLL